MRKFHVISIHCAFIEAYAKFGVVRAAHAKGLAELRTIALRDYAVDKHGSIDDHPYGGGEGMVMRPEPLAAALANFAEKPLVIATSPAGKLWNHAAAQKLAQEKRDVAFVCGRFAGIDQRFLDRYVDEEYSLGDFVVSGGELPVLTMIDSVLRLIPGVLGDADSAKLDSFAEGFDGALEHPLYTRPPVFEGVPVPEVLMAGDHAKIAAWRRDEARRRTAARRPDLLRDTTKPSS